MRLRLPLALSLVLAASCLSGPGHAARPEASSPVRSLRSPGGASTLVTSERWFTVVPSPGASLAAVQEAIAADPELGPQDIESRTPGGLALVRLRREAPPRGGLESALRRLRQHPAVAQATRALQAPDGSPLGLTNRLVILLSEGADRARITELLRRRSGRVETTLSPIHALVAALPSPDGILPLCEELRAASGVVDAHPDFVRPAGRRRALRDPYFAEQWYAEKACLPGAFDVTLGRPDVTIAIVDDGFDLAHEDLADPARLSPLAFDFADLDRDPSAGPLDDHGTAVAGIALASGDNEKGLSGFCPRCGFLPIRRGATDADDMSALVYAADAGAAVINCSWGYSYPSSGVVAAIRHAAEQGRDGLGAVVVFAAGNDGEDIEQAGDISASPGVLAVMASGADDALLPESNFGASALAAPSGGMITTDRTLGGYASGPYFRSFGGTSGAAPGVAGTAALVLSVDPRLSAVQVQDLLRSTSDPIGHAASGGSYLRLNAARAVAAAAGIDAPSSAYLPGDPRCSVTAAPEEPSAGCSFVPAGDGAPGGGAAVPLLALVALTRRTAWRRALTPAPALR